MCFRFTFNAHNLNREKANAELVFDDGTSRILNAKNQDSVKASELKNITELRIYLTESDKQDNVLSVTFNPKAVSGTTFSSKQFLFKVQSIFGICHKRCTRKYWK